MLEGVNISKFFGGLAALKNVSFSLNKREIVGLIGPNGAGKTTLFNIITGFIPPSSGTILFKGKKLNGLKPHKICRSGIARTYQIVKPFSNLTVLENVTVGIVSREKNRVSFSKARSEALEILKLVGLENKESVLAKNLTLMDKKMLEFARALATKPEVLLLDEVCAGLNPTEIYRAIQLIKSLREHGITIFWIEHIMRAIMTVADRIIVLHHGEKIAEGPPKEIANDSRVIDAYLGEKYLLG
ncbi:MAG: ABC transporter ATP-binding protein, partial [Candidatus Methanomethylicia archaeon]